MLNVFESAGAKKAINRVLSYILWLFRPDEKTATPRIVIRRVIIIWCSSVGNSFVKLLVGFQEYVKRYLTKT